MSMLAKDEELIKKACRGSCEDLLHLGIRAYWNYDTITGAATTEEALLAIDAAGVCDEGKCASTVGDFYRFELQGEKADAFYGNSVLYNLDKALNADADAQMNLAEKYAYGRGVEQSDEAACFWTLAASANNNAGAAAAEKNFWQTPGILPVSEEMAGIAEKTNKGFTQEVAAVRKALIEKEAVSTYAEASGRAQKLTKQYKIKDLSKRPGARMLNPVLNLFMGVFTTASIAYLIACILVFVINFFAGYRETGVLRYVTDAFGFLLGVPMKTLLVIMTDYKFAEITTQTICDWFCFNGRLIVGAFGLVFSGVATVIWLGLCFGVYFIVYTIMETLYRQGIKIIPVNNASGPKRRAENCSDKAYNQILLRYPDLAQYAAFEQMAICSIADGKRMGITEACKYFEKLRAAKEDPVMGIQFTYTYKGEYSGDAYTIRSRMGLYFILRRALRVPYMPCPLPNFDAKSDLMDAYRSYRRGKDYKKAESKLQNVIDAKEASTTEKAWAKYFLSELCFNEFLYNYDTISDYKKSDEKNIERGKKLREEAAAECIFANDSLEAVLTRAWAFDGDANAILANLLQDQEVSEYIQKLDGERGGRHACGEPTDREKWEDYKTGTLCSELKALVENVDKEIEAFNKTGQHKSTCQEFEKKLRKFRSELEAMMNKGYMKAGIVHKKLNDIRDSVSAKITEYIQEEHYQELLREHREAQINRMMSEYDDRMDSRERTVNAMVYDDYSTDFERHITGQMSDKHFYNTDYARHLAREKYRAEVEAEYDRQHSYDDDDD